VPPTLPASCCCLSPGRATVFVYRDPRDMLVSHVFYATDMHKGHGMHTYYNETLTTMEERLNAAIQGVTSPAPSCRPSWPSTKATWAGWRSPRCCACASKT
jgi:hypothetical protein